MPISIVIGAAPVVVFTSPQKLAVDMDEYAVAGAVAGRPIEMVKCLTNDLLVPANSEIVIEGYIDPTCSNRRRRSVKATAMSRSKPSTCRCR